MGRPYSEEIDHLPDCMAWAWRQDIKLLRRAIHQFECRNLLPVGSGGSFTAAAFAAQLHLECFGMLSLASTPLDTFSLPLRASMPVGGLLISAEGKNRDICGASAQLLARRIPGIALTLTPDNPLGRYCAETGAATHIAFEMPWRKDGYLATNSLLATLVLIARAYPSGIPVDDRNKLGTWLALFRASVQATQSRLWASKSVVILHGTVGRSGAIDLESKLAEAAFAFGQIANFRQFAHGRHLQLANPNIELGIVAFFSDEDRLADSTLQLVPGHHSLLRVKLPRLHPVAQELASVLAAMVLTERWADESGVDPGQPEVPQFGRDLHQLDVAIQFDPQHRSRRSITPIEQKWPALSEAERCIRERDLTRFVDRLAAARFKALVCDFDGTFCDTIRRFEGLDRSLIPELTRLLAAGVHVGFATGRGDSIIAELKKIPEQFWSRITVGIHSGSTIFQLDQIPASLGEPDPRLIELALWLTRNGILPANFKTKIDSGQMGMRSLPGALRYRVKAHVAEWIQRTGAAGWRVFASGHSIDVLTEEARKDRVVEVVAGQASAVSSTEILRIGDAGDIDGNDYEFMATGPSLSVDSCSASGNTCWNLLPPDRAGVAGTAYYLRSLIVEDARARFDPMYLGSIARYFSGLQDGITLGNAT